MLQSFGLPIDEIRTEIKPFLEAPDCYNQVFNSGETYHFSMPEITSVGVFVFANADDSRNLNKAVAHRIIPVFIFFYLFCFGRLNAYFVILLVLLLLSCAVERHERPQHPLW